MRAEPLVHAEQQALAEQVQVVVADDPAEAVRVVGDVRRGIARLDLEAVVDAGVERREAVHARLEQAVRMQARHRHARVVRVTQQERDRAGARPQRTHDDAAIRRDMSAQQAERIAVLPPDEGVEIGGQRHGEDCSAKLEVLSAK